MSQKQSLRLITLIATITAATGCNQENENIPNSENQGSGIVSSGTTNPPPNAQANSVGDQDTSEDQLYEKMDKLLTDFENSIPELKTKIAKLATDPNLTPEEKKIAYEIIIKEHKARIISTQDEITEYVAARDDQRRAQNLLGSYWIIVSDLGNIDQADGTKVDKTGMLKRAISAWDKSVGLDPGHYLAYYELGLTYLDTHNHDHLARNNQEGYAMIMKGLDNMTKAKERVLEAEARAVRGSDEQKKLAKAGAFILSDLSQYLPFYSNFARVYYKWSQDQLIAETVKLSEIAYSMQPESTVVSWYYAWNIWIYRHETRQKRDGLEGPEGPTRLPMLKEEAVLTDWDEVTNALDTVLSDMEPLKGENLNLTELTMYKIKYIFLLHQSVAEGALVQDEINETIELSRKYYEKIGKPFPKSKEEFFERGQLEVKDELGIKELN